MVLWSSTEDLKKAGEGVFSISNNALVIEDENRFRKDAIDRLIWNAVFAEDDVLKKTAKWIIWEASQKLNCPSASIHELYMARATNKWGKMTVPAINLRGMTYDIARTVFKILSKMNGKACLFEIAKSELEYTMQSPSEYATCILAAAIKENHKGPVFIQGDHFQVNAKKYAKDPEGEIRSLKDLMKDAIEAGFYNIDIDSSTIVDLSKEGVLDQQRPNFEAAAELTKYIRSLQPKGITISVGGEIGEVGGKNSTVEELVAFLEGFNGIMSLDTTKKPSGLSKISVQTGTSHGGVVLANGSIAKVKLDFDTLEKLGKEAREHFGIGGVVQHGASTLPESAFDNFPKRETLEVHLATAFQNTVYESTAFPANLRENIYRWLKQNCSKDVSADSTEEQFYYKTRKKGFGPFKKELWSLTENTKSALMSDLAGIFNMMFKKLGVQNSGKLIDEFVKPVAVSKKFPL